MQDFTSFTTLQLTTLSFQHFIEATWWRCCASSRLCKEIHSVKTWCFYFLFSPLRVKTKRLTLSFLIETCVSFSVLFFFIIIFRCYSASFFFLVGVFRRSRELWPCALKKSIGIKYNPQEAEVENASIGFKNRGFSHRLAAATALFSRWLCRQDGTIAGGV